MQNLAAGLLPTDNRIEFYACNNMAAYCITAGNVVTVDGFSDEILSVIRKDMALHPDKLKGIAAMGVTGDLEVLNQYVVCNYGGFDNSPDLVNGELMHKEYWPCPKRGTCRQEGIVCDGLKTESGKYLTPAEIKVTSMVGKGYLDKEIANELCIAESTVATHTQNIREKAGLKRKAEIAVFAKTHNLI